MRKDTKVAPMLCPALADARSYVRANALGALRVAEERCPDALDRERLVRDHAAVVRAAAAALLHSVAGGEREQDARALERCVLEDPSGEVAVICRQGLDRPGKATEPVTVYVVPSGASSPQSGAPFALIRADGLMRLGLTDKRGAVFEHAAPAGALRLAEPAPLVP